MHNTPPYWDIGQLYSSIFFLTNGEENQNVPLCHCTDCHAIFYVFGRVE